MRPTPSLPLQKPDRRRQFRRPCSSTSRPRTRRRQGQNRPYADRQCHRGKAPCPDRRSKARSTPADSWIDKRQSRKPQPNAVRQHRAVGYWRPWTSFSLMRFDGLAGNAFQES